MRAARAPRRQQSLPVREEARQRVLLHRLDFAAQLGQRFAPDLPQNLRVAPLAVKAARAEAAFKHAALLRKLPQRIFHRLCVERKPVRSLAQRERPVRARVAAHQFEHGMRHRLQQCNRQPRRQRNPESIAVARCIFGSDQPLFAGDAQLQQSPRADRAGRPASSKSGETTRRANSSRERSPSRRQRS